MKTERCTLRVGVGPGDPELTHSEGIPGDSGECQVIAAPDRIPEETVAYGSRQRPVPFLKEKERVGVEMPMTKDREVLERSPTERRKRDCGPLEEGRDVAFLTLGDPCVYSTYFLSPHPASGSGGMRPGS